MLGLRRCRGLFSSRGERRCPGFGTRTSRCFPSLRSTGCRPWAQRSWHAGFVALRLVGSSEPGRGLSSPSSAVGSYPLGLGGVLLLSCLILVFESSCFLGQSSQRFELSWRCEEVTFDFIDSWLFFCSLFYFHSGLLFPPFCLFWGSFSFF